MLVGVKIHSGKTLPDWPLPVAVSNARETPILPGGSRPLRIQTGRTVVLRERRERLRSLARLRRGVAKGERARAKRVRVDYAAQSNKLRAQSKLGRLTVCELPPTDARAFESAPSNGKSNGQPAKGLEFQSQFRNSLAPCVRVCECV